MRYQTALSPGANARETVYVLLRDPSRRFLQEGLTLTPCPPTQLRSREARHAHFERHHLSARLPNPLR